MPTQSELLGRNYRGTTGVQAQMEREYFKKVEKQLSKAIENTEIKE